MPRPYQEIARCRICGNRNLIPILSLGNQCLTGVFPRTKSQKVTSGPLDLVKCREDRRGDACGLLQLKQSYNKSEMYGKDYGYRSGLNRAMIEHLRGLVKNVLRRVSLSPGDLVVDIGSNDSTLLQAYPRGKRGPLLVGIDPSAGSLRKFYPPHIRLILDFFSAEALRRRFPGKKAKVVTSIAMFYDLESPMDFMRQIVEILADDGVWILEQSYLPTMIKATAYDTICHEHLEYYALKQIHWMTERVGLKILDVQFTDVNGGSFSVIMAKSASRFRENAALVRRLISNERRAGFGGLETYRRFRKRMFEHRKRLLAFLEKARQERKMILGYGASTKGNVILQFCGLTVRDMPAIAEVNSRKFGCFTPGTRIPIISERAARAAKPDYLLVMPWHFKTGIAARERGYLKAGGRLVFPLPTLHTLAK
jgi:NDP-4-keto-2,6-dideoxyhexose 3-C-methyltransferase